MSWVEECFEQQRQIDLKKKANHKIVTNPIKHPAPWQSTWDRIFAALDRDVADFNRHAGARQFTVSPQAGQGTIIQILPGSDAKRIATSVLEIEKSGTIQLTQPPEGSGIGRRGKFQIDQDKIVALPNFTGTPKPPDDTMTPDRFVKEVVLKPLLFPDVQ